MIKLLKPKPPPAISGFGHVVRYFDRHNQMFAAKIKPGEFYVSNVDEIIVTVLGSCVAACIRDKVNRVGGMNHFLLAPNLEQSYEAAPVNFALHAHGLEAMDRLIESILRNGGELKNLEVKLFGGSEFIKGTDGEGQTNIDFLTDYARARSLQVLSSDLGGVHARKLMYNPMTGVVRVKKLRNLHNDTILRRETQYRRNIALDF